MKKEFWKSKTLWANALIVIGGVCVLLAVDLQTGIPITVAGVANILLRVLTNSGIK